MRRRLAHARTTRARCLAPVGPYKPTDLGAECGHSEDSMRWVVCGALVYLMAACFAFFAPLGYGTPMSVEELDSRMWLKAWR